MKNRKRLKFRALRAQLTFLVIFPWMSFSSLAEEDWGRGFIDATSAADSERVKCSLSFLSCTDGHLIGQFRFVNGSKMPITLQGSQTQDGKFWPSVVAQVTNGSSKRHWKWRKIGTLTTNGKSATVVIKPITVDVEGYKKELLVNLDTFKPLVGKASYGRVVFNNGNWSIFELKDLLPPR